ncbi:hypothetical protein GGH19_004638 [Coemansia sp. RSA 1807]|nr:hypothetical protein GGH19_004638 [Coemansia sp. RSA 1807]
MSRKQNRVDMNLAAGFGVAGVKRFPPIGSVFNTLKEKSKLSLETNMTSGVGLIEQLSKLIDSQDTAYTVENSKPKVKRKALTVRSALRQIKVEGQPLRVKQACELIRNTQHDRVPSVALARRRTDADGHMSLVLDLDAEQIEGSTYAWAVMTCRKLENIRDETRKLRHMQRMQFLPPLNNVKHGQMPKLDVYERAVVNSELAELDARWAADAGSQTLQEKLIREMLALARGIDRRVRVNLEAFGSRLYGLSTSASDFDLAMSIRVPQRNAEVGFMRFVRHFVVRLQRTRGFQRVVWLQHARVPIVKFVYRTSHGEHECDVSFNHGLGMAKSRMIHTYMRSDPRVRQVLMVLKEWAITRAISNQNAMNSFGVMLMGLTYLAQERVVPPLQLLTTNAMNTRGWKNLAALQQSREQISALYLSEQSEPIRCVQSGEQLPDWRVEGKNAYFLAKSVGWQSPNKQTVPELLFGLFRFYGCEFEPENHAVSLRLGSARIARANLHELKVQMPEMVLGRPQMWRENLRLLAVEDPFEPQVNCARSAQGEWVEGLLWEMRRAAAVLRSGANEGRVLSALFVPPTPSIYCDASVWASVYGRLFPTLQQSVNEHVFDLERDMTPETIIPIEELEAAQIKNTN